MSMGKSDGKKKKSTTLLQCKLGVEKPLSIEQLRFWLLVSEQILKTNTGERSAVTASAAGFPANDDHRRNAIKKIEEALECTLLEVDPRKSVSLTLDGLRLRDFAKDILDDYTKMRRSLSASTLVIGATTTLLVDLVRDFLSSDDGEWLRDQPNLLQIEFIAKEWSELSSAVRAGQIHVVAAPTFAAFSKQLNGQVVLSRGWALAFKKNHPRKEALLALENAPSLSEGLAEAIGDDWLQIVASHVQPKNDLLIKLGLAGKNIRTMLQPTSRACLRFAEIGIGVAVVPDPRIYRHHTSNITYVRLNGLTEAAEVSCYLPSEPRPEAKSFCESLLEYGKTISYEYFDEHPLDNQQ